MFQVIRVYGDSHFKDVEIPLMEVGSVGSLCHKKKINFYHSAIPEQHTK
jgi:hypothetical protein